MTIEPVIIMATQLERRIDVSIILPVYNAFEWLPECLCSILTQVFDGKLELSVYNDGSIDKGMDVLDNYRDKFQEKDIQLTIGNLKGTVESRGVGYAKNKAIQQSCGEYLCFQDADDVMMTMRIQKQFDTARQHSNAIVGCQFHREPADSTERFTKWANKLTPEQLYHQAYTAHGPTVVMPTWFCSRKTLEIVGQFNESGKGTPEDLIFFYEHLDAGGKIVRVDEDLLVYRYHPAATTFSIHEDTIWNIRMIQLQKTVLSFWQRFTIWNAGKQGRKFYRSLSESNKLKVEAFCDVDEKKITKGVYTYEESTGRPKPKIPIIHYQQAKPPFIICVKQDLTGGVFEENLVLLNLKEGVDYFFFS